MDDYNFEPQQDVDNTEDTVTRAFAIPRQSTVPSSSSNRNISRMVESSNDALDFAQLVTDIHIEEGRSGISVRSKSNKKLPWHKNATRTFDLFYLGSRPKEISRYISLTSPRGRLYRAPTAEGYAHVLTKQYSTAITAVRNFLLSIMADELRLKCDGPVGPDGKKKMSALHLVNYKVHNHKLADFEPHAHYVVSYDHLVKEIVLYRVVISLSDPTNGYPFQHYRMLPASPDLKVPREVERSDVLEWIQGNT